MSTTIRNLLKSSGHIIGAVASVLTIGSIMQDFNNKSLKTKYELEISRNRELESKVTELLENKITDEENKNKIIEIVTRKSNSVELVRSDVNKIQELNTNLNKPDLNDETKENLINQLNEHVGKLNIDMNKVNGDLSDIIEIIKGSGTSNQY